jgi:hypothetical protein
VFGLSARFRILLAVVLGAGLVAAGQSAKPAVAERQIGIEHFMAGLACIESSGRYNAVNRRSGALGKYQIMPRNWRNWSGRVLGDQKARATPENQEIVAHWRISRLYSNRGSWRRVAYWWLTGRSTNDESRWTRKAVRYVDRVMELAQAAARGSSRVPRRCHPNLPESLAMGASSLETVRVRARALNVRRNAGVGNRITAIVRRGAQLTVLDQTELRNGRTWLRVELPSGRRGWVAGWYTRPIQAD